MQRAEGVEQASLEAVQPAPPESSVGQNRFRWAPQGALAELAVMVLGRHIPMVEPVAGRVRQHIDRTESSPLRSSREQASSTEEVAAVAAVALEVLVVSGDTEAVAAVEEVW